jgi:hypothetical protein
MIENGVCLICGGDQGTARLARLLGYRPDIAYAKLNKAIKLLKERDGGAHDKHCKVHYGLPCTCQHDEVVEFLNMMEE